MEISNLIVAFQRKTAIVFVGNLIPYRLLFQPLMVHFGYQWLRHFEPEHAALVKLGSKRVYVSVSVKHSCTQFYGISRWSLPGLKIVNEEAVFWVAIDSDFICGEQWICRGTSWYVPLMLCYDRYNISERHVFLGSKWSGRQALSPEQKRQNRKKQTKKRNELYDWLTDATRLKLVMKNKQN